MTLDASSPARGDAGSLLDGPTPDVRTNDASRPTDPFAPQPDASAGLTNVSASLADLLENGMLPGACAAYAEGATDQRTMLLCGKWKFFYDAFGTSGIPTSLVQFLATNFPNQLGLGFSKLGLIPDPTSTTNMPLGLAPTVDLGTNVPAVAFTCASCHLARLSDGRYAVGAPNEGYDYARHILTISLVPVLASGLSSASDHDPAAVAEVQPVLDALSADPSLNTQLLTTLLPLASLHLPAIGTVEEHDYTQWPTGTMDFLIAPLPIDDHIHIVGKIIGLWGIPQPSEATAAGMTSGLLGWTGDADGLGEFLNGFAVLGGAPSPAAADVAPLIAYIYSLRAPTNPTPPDPAKVASGEQLFASKGCTSCHDGPRGSGKHAYTVQDIGTDPTVEQWADPTLSGAACCGVPNPRDGMTHGVKSPRLVGMWTLERFLHNGSLTSLGQLFCQTDSPRPPVGEAPMLTTGHSYTCDGLTETEKEQLIAYLEAH
jgi:mono/diheme cytochrome c family protein